MTFSSSTQMSFKLSFSYFFLPGFSFTNIHKSQDCRGRGRATPHYHFHSLHIHLDLSQAITSESSPLHIACSQTRTRNLWFLSTSRLPLFWKPCVKFRSKMSKVEYITRCCTILPWNLIFQLELQHNNLLWQRFK